MLRHASLWLWVVLSALIRHPLQVRGLDAPEAGASALPGAAEAAPSTPAPYRNFKVSIGYHFSSGNYGEAEKTTIHYVPLVLTGELSRWSAQLTIPYLSISGPAGFIEGGPVGPIETDGHGEGLGDILLRASYLLPWRDIWPVWVPYIGLAGVVKFPTASRSDGLGTGAFDLGIDTELTWAVQPLTPFATIGGRFLGDLPDTELRNVVVASVGAAYQIIDTVSAGLLLDYRQPSSGSSGDRLEIVPFGSWKFMRPWSIETYLSAGLADGSPDVGVGFQLGYTWR
jgi:hypothetical protein